CYAHQAPIVLRGGGTGLAGQACNRAVVIDVSKYVNQILAIDPDRCLARVEPGVVCDELVRECAQYELTFGPKPATHDRCCFGGMISNNCGGMEAQIHGSGVNNVEAMEVLLYDGRRMTFGWMSDEDLADAIRRGGREGELYARVRALRHRY